MNCEGQQQYDYEENGGKRHEAKSSSLTSVSLSSMLVDNISTRADRRKLLGKASCRTENNDNLSFDSVDQGTAAKSWGISYDSSQSGTLTSVAHDDNSKMRISLDHKDRGPMIKKSGSDCSFPDIGIPHPTSSSTWPSITVPPILKPRTNHIYTLFVTLALTTSLAFFSAVDATIQCTHGTNAWARIDNYYYQQQDDYYQTREEEALSCRFLFLNIILPIFPLVIISCALASMWTLRDDRRWGEGKTGMELELPSVVTMGGYEDSDKKRLEELRAHVKNQVQHLKSCYQLLAVSALCLGLWTYAQFIICAQSDEEIEDFGGYDDAEVSLSKKEFLSLGAINTLGEVGQNANLYYTCWISLGISIALFLELSRITHIQRSTTNNLASELTVITRHMEGQTTAVETVMAWTQPEKNHINEKRNIWYCSLQKIRLRTGIWASILISSLVIFASANRIWRNSVYPSAVAAGEIDEDGNYCPLFQDFFSEEIIDTISMCVRTKASIFIGLACVPLSLCALLAHLRIRTLMAQEAGSSRHLLTYTNDEERLSRKKKMVNAYRVESFFALILAALLGTNAAFTTAVDGPAPNAGNLYYASWISFLLSMRITLLCIEGIVHEKVELKRQIYQRQRSRINTYDSRGINPTQRSRSNTYDSKDFNQIKKSQLSEYDLSDEILETLNTRQLDDSLHDSIVDSIITKIVMLKDIHVLPQSPSKKSGVAMDDEVTVASYYGGISIPEKSELQRMYEEKKVEEEDTSRTKRLQRWGSQVIFASLYALSVRDAAFHLSEDGLDMRQKYMVLCPVVVAIICGTMFSLCLRSRTYELVDNFYFGGLICMFTVVIWVCNLVITLHSESSWAVNDIGEVKIANLYYFTWATAVNGGILFSSYVKKKLNVKSKEIMIIVWMAVAKVCFVMFGSCVDIFITVREECESSEDEVVLQFCSRTTLGAFLAFIGMAFPALAIIYRLLFSKSKTQLRVELFMAEALTIIFGICLALITGIGGPGQKVGDLYYGSWLAFLASLVSACSLHEELRKLKATHHVVCNSSSEEESKKSENTHYLKMEGTLT